MVRSTLFGMQILALSCTVLLFAFALYVGARTGNFRARWHKNQKELGLSFLIGHDIMYFMSVTTIIVTIYGVFSLFLAGYGMLTIYNIVLAVIAVFAAFMGIVLLVEVQGDQGRIGYVQLSTILNTLQPEHLRAVEQNFHCCGIYKYTDYTIPGREWNSEFVGSRWPGMGDEDEDRFKHIEIETEKPEEYDYLDRFKKTRRRKLERSRNYEGDAVEKRDKKRSRSKAQARNKEVGIDIEVKVINITLGRKGLSALDQLTVQPFTSSNDIVDWMREVDMKMDPLKISTFASVQYIVRNITSTAPKRLDHMYSDVIHTMLQLASLLMDIVEHKKTQLVYWWFNSGWDKHLLRWMKSDDKEKIPKTCCRNPTRFCTGNFHETWPYGCKFKVLWHWENSFNQLLLSCYVYFLILLATILVVYVYIAGVRNKYYL